MSAVEEVEVGCRSCSLNHHFMKKQSLREGGQLGLKVHGMGKRRMAKNPTFSGLLVNISSY